MHRFVPLLALAAVACTVDVTPPLCDGPDCGPASHPCVDDGRCPGPVLISELMAKNDGAWIDEAMEADDFIELVNGSEADVSLLGWFIGDRPEPLHPLPDVTLAPGEVLLLWADEEPAQGPTHLPFKLSSAGETIFLQRPDGELADRVPYPPLAPNDSHARLDDGRRVVCPFATPARPNGASCAAPGSTGLPEEVVFAQYSWPVPSPGFASPLSISELALRPAGFVEILNTSGGAVDLSELELTVAPHAPDFGWPTALEGALLAWPVPMLDAGERVVVAVDPAAVSGIAATADYEGVVTLWRVADGAVIDRVDFMSWPSGAALARDSAGNLRFCTAPGPGTADDGCTALGSRAVGSRLRHAYTPSDLSALAAGGTALGMEAVKFVVDMDSGDVVHLLSAASWDLHYTFVREVIDGLPHLDRCDPMEAATFRSGWIQFSVDEYFNTTTRRYLLGTLVHHTGAGVRTVEFTTGDAIIAPQMERAFYAVTPNTGDPTAWSLRPQSQRQIDEARLIEGNLPLVDPNAPFRDQQVQLLAPGVAYGTLTFVPTGELATASVSSRTVVVTDQVPNDIPLVGGLITETFQTPLSHVNVLSKGRGTPNMALRDGRNDLRVAPFVGLLVRLEVTGGGFTIQTTTSSEAEAFWATQFPQTTPLVPRLDTSVGGVQSLSQHDLESLPVLGAKAAQLAELATVWSSRSACMGPVPIPRVALALPVVHSLEHYSASGAAARLVEIEGDPDFRADPGVRASGLAEVRGLIAAHPVDGAVLSEVEAFVAGHYGSRRVRFRSSSNTEDLPNFNGAGLYTSRSGALNDPEQPIEDAIRAVWASLYNLRAYDERRLHNVVESEVAMGILMHPAFLSEEANGVAISRNILDPIRGDQYYLNLQAGEASVANPAPGISSDALLYRWGRNPPVMYQAQSNLPFSAPVMHDAEVAEASCYLRAIHDHFRPLLDPTGENRWFAMDIELKLEDASRDLVIKQARPYSFGSASATVDCREF